MIAFGIDVSKGRSTMSILPPMGDTKVLMEATGRYHETIASELHEQGIFVSVINSILIYHFNYDSTVRKVKTNKKDSMKIAKYDYPSNSAYQVQKIGQQNVYNRHEHR